MKKFKGLCTSYIHLEIVSIFTKEEFEAFKTFKDFWDEIDVINAYEEEWSVWVKRGIKQVYRDFYNEALK